MIAAMLLCLLPALVGVMVLAGWAILALWPARGEATEVVASVEGLTPWSTVLRTLRETTPRKAGRPAVRRIRLAWASHRPVSARMGKPPQHTRPTMWAWSQGPPW